METIIKKISSKYSQKSRDNLIPILQDIQNEQGYLSEESIIDVGNLLNLPTSKIYGVATFYNQFRFQPIGKYHIQICRGTACHVLGSLSVLEKLENVLNVKSGETTKDGLFSIEVVACIGACGLAPVICINGSFHANVDENAIVEIIESYRSKTQ